MVRPLAKPGTYELIAGERRWRATRMAGKETIPAIVRDIADEATLALALIENIQRENLNPLEEATALKRLIEEFELTHAEAAKSVRAVRRVAVSKPAASAGTGAGSARNGRSAPDRTWATPVRC